MPFKLQRFTFSAAALEGKQLGAEGAKEADEKPNPDPEEIGENNGAWKDESYPSGEFDYKKIEGWSRFVVQLKMFIAPPWERVKKGSVLHMKLRGEILDQLQGSFSSRLSLPKISENFMKAAYDPRIAGIYLEIEPLNCAWGKIDEIRRHILDYKKSGVLEKAGVTPQIQRIGKYKSAGDLLSRKNISEENREMLTVILDNIYENWVQKISSTLGKTKENIEIFLNEGIYKVERLKQEGWITDIKYDDEVTTMLKERLGQKLDKELLLVDYKKYSRVRKWTLGLAGGRDKIAIIRASGSISRVSSRLNVSRSGIAGEQFIKKIREVRASKRYKAVILRIDSPGGDALASDLMWREIRLLAAEKPVVASMGDVAASGGYYMAMGAGVIVSESLTLTGSIGVVTGKFNLNKLYDRVGFNKEVISRGRFAELDVEQRPFRPDEEELFAKSAQNAYKQFRDKAAFSRSMSVDSMEAVAQGRVWTGKDAASLGLVDAIGGFSRAVAIAKQKANIPLDRKVSLVELSRSSPSLPELISGGARAIFGLPSLLSLDERLKELFQELSPSGVQARMDSIILQGLGEYQDGQVFLKIIKDYLSSF